MSKSSGDAFSRVEIYDAVRIALYRMPRPASIFKPANCGEIAFATAAYLRRELAELGPDVMVQAGTAGWVTFAASDGKPVEAAYEFHADDERTRGWVRRGWMPEMHLWVAVRAGNGWVIVDPSRPFLPEAFTTDYGYLGEAMRWPGAWEAGGDFVECGTPEELGEVMRLAACRYAGDAVAAVVAVAIWAELIARPGKLQALGDAMGLSAKWLRTVHEPLPVLELKLYGGKKCPFRAFRGGVRSVPIKGGESSDGKSN